MAALRERLRLARDVHDLLGLGLSAVALKADLIAALVGHDNARAAAEIDEMQRICAAAQADVTLVTERGVRLSLAGELAAAQQILASADIQVRAGIPPGRLPPAADAVLAPMLREAVTNILRHAAATACVIEVTTGVGMLRLRIRNDGVAGLPRAAGRGSGLANMTARVQAAGGRLACWHADGRFQLTAQIPLPAVQHAAEPGTPQLAAAGLDHPGNFGGSDSWEDAGSWRHSGSTPRSCAIAR